MKSKAEAHLASRRGKNHSGADKPKLLSAASPAASNSLSAASPAASNSLSAASPAASNSLSAAALSWDDLRILLAVHRHGSFFGAAEHLRVATSTVSRRIDQLESSLGRILVQRSASGTRVEDEALPLIGAAEKLESGLGALMYESQQQGLAGTVRISMPEGFILPATGVLAGLCHEHPELQIEAISESRLVNVSRREADIAIRKTKTSSADLIQKKVGLLSFHLFASPEYLESFPLVGKTLSVAELRTHRVVAYDESGKDFSQNRWFRAQGVEKISFRSNSDFAIREAVSQGMGIGLLAFAKGHEPADLCKISCEIETPSLPVYLICRREHKKVPKIRLVYDALEAGIRQALPIE